MVVHQPNLMERLCLKGGDFETGITGLSKRSLHRRPVLSVVTADKSVKQKSVLITPTMTFLPSGSLLSSCLHSDYVVSALNAHFSYFGDRLRAIALNQPLCCSSLWQRLMPGWSSKQQQILHTPDVKGYTSCHSRRTLAPLPGRLTLCFR